MRTLVAVGLLLIAAPAYAQATVTVESLLKQSYDVAGVVPSHAGRGVPLEDDKLFMCFVTETPGSPDISTQYCKPVR